MCDRSGDDKRSRDSDTTRSSDARWTWPNFKRVATGLVIQFSPHTRILVAIEPVDGRKGIDGLIAICKQQLNEDPFSGCIFVFRNRSWSSIRLLAYDGQGFLSAQKRLSQGRFKIWPKAPSNSCELESCQAHVLLAAGDPGRVCSAPAWKPIRPRYFSGNQEKRARGQKQGAKASGN